MAQARTNIEIETSYVDTIMVRYRLRTTTEVVELALRPLAGSPMTVDETLSMRGSRPIERLPEVTPRGLVDCLIAAVALRTGAAVLAADEDLRVIATVVPMSLDPDRAG
jgi:Arc/MetJ family transcription regulator